MDESRITFGSNHELLKRLNKKKDMTGGKEEYVFLIGAALSISDRDDSKGIPSTDGMVNIIRDELGENESFTKDYKDAFQQLLNRNGRHAIPTVVENAVKCAWLGSEMDNNIDEIENTYKQMESQLHNWYVPYGQRALGNLIAEFPMEFGKYLLTTNFDPLAAISIRRSRYRAIQTAMFYDGNPSQTIVAGCHIIHLHGYWYRNSLHNPLQIENPRPILLNYLKDLIRHHPIVVIGYSGWDDVFTKAICEVIADQEPRPESSPDIMWCFHNKSPLTDNAAHKVMERLDQGHSLGFIQYYNDIDCNLFLPKLLASMRGLNTPMHYERIQNGSQIVNETKDLLKSGIWLLFSSHGARAVIRLKKEEDGKQVFEMQRLFSRDRCAFLAGQGDSSNIEPIIREWELDEYDDLILRFTQNYSLHIHEPLSSPIHWCEEQVVNSEDRVKTPFEENLERNWQGAWKKNDEERQQSLDPLKPLKNPSADFVAIHVCPWKLESDEFENIGVREGHWIKMAEFGGNYLVKLDNEGKFVETHLFDQWKRTEGRWWLDKSSKTLNLWVADWNLEIINNHRVVSPDENIFNKVRNPKVKCNIDYENKGLLFPCVEKEDYRHRETNFYVAHLFPSI